jgi:hypothetical protein
MIVTLISIFFSTYQTLTTLHISGNEISGIGAQHLADALRHNTVILILFSFLAYSSSLVHIDAHRTRS